ncbi:hypothetical protein HWA77_19240 [Photobacterium damselae subsp. damselae]|uniref:Molecular chaperone n=1 Tax=Photobacterium damselae subsp. damselae TaxID=85581 RepID=A0A850R1R0_PHODD|nr:hypothetical protein [Photobacterium damselae subsp. damselae]
MKKLVLGCILLGSTGLNAMALDTMLKVADKNGQGAYVVTNNELDPVFVNVNLAKIKIKQGDVVKDYYTKDNLLSWEASVTQNKFIVKPGMKKIIGIRALCADSCDENHDSIFAAQFTPTPYKKKGKEEKGVSISYGYESIFIIPAKNKKISYTIKKNKSLVRLKNDSNTTLKVFFNQCSAMFKSDCSIKSVLLPGRVRTIKLPKNAQKGNINTIVTSIDDDFYRKEVLGDENELHFSKKIN